MTKRLAFCDLRLATCNWSENFPFTRVADVPSGDKPATGATPYLPADAVRARLGDGSFGGPYQVSDEMMQGLFEVTVAKVVQLLKVCEADPIKR